MGSRPRIHDLAFVGDRCSTAAVDRSGRICWYCPGRFDGPTVFASLLDPAAGEWRVLVPDMEDSTRRYLGESAVLQTRLHTPGGTWTLTDWMPVGAPQQMLCRQLDAAPTDAQVTVDPRPDYGSSAVRLQLLGNDDGGSSVSINQSLCIHASLPASVDGPTIRYRIPAGASAWFVLGPAESARPSGEDVDRWRQQTLDYWDTLHERTSYAGPYERQVKASLRALRLLTHSASGGIIAAATLGLPEVAGGQRNYDYRYVWLRDAAMIVSALTRAGSDGADERAFLGFLCSASQHGNNSMPLPPFVNLDGTAAPATRELPWSGYADSRPVLVGNDAGEQLQLDGLANVLLAAKLIYNAHQVRDHWETVAEIADYLAEHWSDADHGIWEEARVQQYTASKVVTAVALGFIAEHSGDPLRAERWRSAARAIRSYVAQHCLTSNGAYAAVAGGEAVDVSAALFPVWDYCAPDEPAMIATMTRLERDSSTDGLLYRRHLECDDAREEGAFLAGTFWVAQYWIMRGDLARAERIIDAALKFANDVGLMAEEAEPTDGCMLGNIPQSFVHAALIGAVIDLRAAAQTGG
ncbi:MAG: glycoside hydrolase family 15 protein [Pseudomonadales bacterium]